MSRYLAPGTYEAVLWKVEDKPSKAGNPMWTLFWDVLAEDGKQTLRDWILKDHRGLWKLEQLAEAWGVPVESLLPQEHLERHVIVTVQLEEDLCGFPQRNKITGYRAAPREAK